MSNSKRRVINAIPPLSVLADLREGNLASLDKYILLNGGIPDRSVAVELRKLISGSRYRTRFRLQVVKHPDSPQSRGGRRPKANKEPTPKQIEYVEFFARSLLVEGKQWLALEKVAAHFGVHKSTIRRAVVAVAEAGAKYLDASTEG